MWQRRGVYCQILPDRRVTIRYVIIAGFVVLVVLVVLFAVPWYCDLSADHGHDIARTRTILRSCCEDICDARYFSNEEPPTDLPGLVKWLANAEIGIHEAGYVDIERNTILDSWGRQIIVLKSDGRLTGVASCGANGTWENGKGDDIVWRVPKADTQPAPSASTKPVSPEGRPIRSR